MRFVRATFFLRAVPLADANGGKKIQSYWSECRINSTPGQGNVDTVPLESAGWAVSAEAYEAFLNSIKKILNGVFGGFLDGRNEWSALGRQAHQVLDGRNEWSALGRQAHRVLDGRNE